MSLPAFLYVPVRVGCVATQVGVATAFNAPIGGLLFAFEEVASFWQHSLGWQVGCFDLFDHEVQAETVGVGWSGVEGRVMTGRGWMLAETRPTPAEHVYATRACWFTICVQQPT